MGKSKVWKSVKQKTKTGIKKAKKIYDDSDVLDTIREKSKSAWRTAKIKAKKSKADFHAFKRRLQSMINKWIDTYKTKLEENNEKRMIKKLKSIQYKRFKKLQKNNTPEDDLEINQKKNRKTSLKKLEELEAKFGYKRLKSKKLRSKRLKRLRSKRLDRLRSKRLDRLRSKRLDRLRSKRLDRLRSKRLHRLKSKRLHRLKSKRLDRLKSKRLKRLKKSEIVSNVVPKVSKKLRRLSGQNRADKSERMSK